MLAIYTWVFGTIFPARWVSQPATGLSASEGQPATSEFVLILFVGLILFSFFSDVVNRAPALVVTSPNYVKRVVFPLEVLPIVAVGSAAFNGALSLAVLAFFMLLLSGGIPITAVSLPLIIAPLMIFTLGLAWFLAALGVYLRDIGQLLGPITMAMMFLSPIFYPSSALPENIRGWIFLNPLSLPIEQARDVLIWGRLPNFSSLALYTFVASGIAVLGLYWFQSTRKGFADVI